MLPNLPPSNFELTRQFHKVLGQLPPPSVGTIGLRMRLIEEEAQEARVALNELRGGRGTLAEVAKELADLLYTTYGTAVALGIDLDKVFREVHRSNMTKVGGPTRADGKARKGDGYIPPDLTDIVLIEQENTNVPRDRR